MRTITTADRKFTWGRILLQGVNVAITFVESYTALMTVEGVDGFDKPSHINLKNAYKWLKGFKAPPSDKTIAKWMDEGIAMTVTGKRVEPDGIGPDGSPSWLIVLGMI